MSAVLIARALGPEGRGLYVIPLVLITIASALMSQGLELAQVRLWAVRRETAREWAASAAWLALPIGVAAAAVVWLVYELGRSGPFDGVSRLELGTVVVLLPMMVHSLLIRGLLVIDHKLAAVNRALVTGDVCRTAGVVIVFLIDHMSVGVALLLYAPLVVVPWAMCLRALDGPRVGPLPRGLVRAQLSSGWRLTPHFLFLTLNLRLDVLLLAALADAEDVGLYSVAVLIAELVWLPTYALAQATKAQQAVAEPSAATDVTARAVRVTVVISALCGVVLALVGPLALLVAFGSDFAPALPALLVLLPGSMAMAVWRLLTVTLARLAPIGVTAGIALAAVAVNVGLNVLLIPRLGILGAAVASLASYGCGAGMALVRFRAIGRLPWTDLVPRRSDLESVWELVRPAMLRRHLAELRAAARTPRRAA